MIIVDDITPSSGKIGDTGVLFFLTRSFSFSLLHGTLVRVVVAALMMNVQNHSLGHQLFEVCPSGDALPNVVVRSVSSTLDHDELSCFIYSISPRAW